MKNAVVCVGELLMDFICTENEVDLYEGRNFLKSAGGAPANVACTVARLGQKASFVGKIGEDSFGEYLRNHLNQENVDIEQLIIDSNHATTVAFLAMQENKERDYIFHRGADEKLELDEIDLEKILDTKIIHFGSATALLGGSIYDVYKKIYDEAIKKNIFISFDPNFRKDLWNNNKDEFIEKALYFVKNADFVKASEEEVLLLSKKEDLRNGMEFLHEKGAKIIVVTMGERGSLVSTNFYRERMESIKIDCVDSIGAGDSFVGAWLSELSYKDDIKRIYMKVEDLRNLTYFANVVGALTCRKIGSIDSIPTLQEVLKYRK